MWELFLQMAISTLLSELLRPKSHFDRPKPAGIDEITFPTSSEDRAIPVPWGTVKQEALNLLWYGDYQAVELTKTVRTGLFSKETMHMGYQYYMGMQMGLCIDGVDEIREVWAGETKIYTGPTSANSVVMVSGSWKEGDQDSGMSGQMSFHSGATVPNSYVATKVAINPNFKHMTYAVLGGYISAPGLLPQPGYVGINQSLRALKFVLRRLPKVVRYGVSQADYDAFAAVGPNDANPSYCILEAMCNADWGAGIPPQLIDLDTFRLSAARLKNEGNGLSLLWDSPRPVGDIIGEINKQANGVLYSDLTTGLVNFNLLREDNGVAFEFNEDTILRLEGFTRAAADEATNTVRLPFKDITAGFLARAAVSQDLGGIEAAGQIIPATVQYPGVSSRELAVALAARDLRMAAATLAKVSIRAVLPVGKFLHPGDLVKVNWSPLGLSNLGMRVLSVRYSDSGKGEVSLELVQDIFLPGVSIYSASVPALTAGTGNSVKPGIPVNVGAFFAPYSLSKTDADRAMVFVEAPDANTTSYDVAYFNANVNLLEYDQRSGIGFAAYGALQAPVVQAATTGNITISVNSANAATLKRYGSQPVLFSIDDEMFQASTITLTTNDTRAVFGGITRAIWDTVPQAHSTYGGVLVWCDYVIDPSPLKTVIYSSPGVVAASYDGQPVYGTGSLGLKARGRNSAGASALSAAGGISEGFKTGEVRAALPYAPGNIRLANTLGTGVVGAGTIVTATGSATVLSWAPRSRTTGGLNGWATGDLKGDPGVSHLVQVSALINGSWTSILAQTFGETITSCNLNFTNTPKPSQLEVVITPFKPVGANGIYGKAQFWYWNLTA